MRTAKGSRWVTLYRYENNRLVVIHEPLRDYEVHNLLVKGWEHLNHEGNPKNSRRNEKK